jgi:3-methyladenine DNA glycosylase/8-oxoguanine DNA glycosylase
MPVRHLDPPDRYDLRATLRALEMKSAGRTAVRGGEVLYATRTPEGPGTMTVYRSGRRLEAEAWGPGASWLLETAPQMLGLDDDVAGFDPPPGLIRDLHRAHPGLRLGKTQRPFGVVVTAILGQRVTGRQAKTGHARLVRAHGEPAPGPHELMLAPSPERLASLDYQDYHRFEIEKARAARLIEAGRRARRIDEVLTMSHADARRRLEAISGIGPWTAAAVMGIALGDRDAVQVGDYHAPHTVAWALAKEPRGDDARMLELLEPYAGQRRRVLVLLKTAGISAPKFGPRSPITSIGAM